MLLEIENGIPFMITLWLLSSLTYGVILIVLIRFLKHPLPKTPVQPSCTVLIAMRNEAANLPALFASLDQLDYPVEKLEIWLLDDMSEDDTPALAQEFALQRPHVHYLRITEELPGLKGKMNALAQGIERSHGEIILTTDADCQVPPGWIQHTAQFFADPNVALVGGANKIRGKDLLAAFQRLDLLYLLGVASAFAHAGLPLSILGNNMAFRRRAYQAVGGFQALGMSIVEDAALLHAFRRRRSFAIRFPLIQETMVTSTPAATLRAFFQQRLRWAVGGKQVAPPWIWLVLLPGILPRVLFWPGIALASLPVALGISGFIMLADLLFLTAIFRKLHARFQLRHWLAFELAITIYLPILALVVPFKQTATWKNRRYSVRQGAK